MRFYALALVLLTPSFSSCDNLAIKAETTEPAGEVTLAPPPEAARRGDPDLSLVEDERLKALYLETTIGLRRLEREPSKRIFQSPVAGVQYNFKNVDEYIRIPKSVDDKEYLLSKANESLDATPPDWNLYRVALWAMKAGMVGDARVVPIARKALIAPRGEKLSDAHGHSLIESIRLLGVNETEEAVKLLEQCATREFWGSVPIRSRSLSRKPESALGYLAGNTMAEIARMPSDLSLPALERLLQRYPDEEESGLFPVREYGFEKTAGRAITSLIWEIKKREGLNAGLHPIEMERGMTFEEIRERNKNRTDPGIP